jgi:hypothetical protein
MNHADQAARDLAHIRTMILRLEQLLHDNGTGEPSPVTSPDYWGADQCAPGGNLSPALEAQARALLARLDLLIAASYARSTIRIRHRKKTHRSPRPGVRARPRPHWRVRSPAACIGRTAMIEKPFVPLSDIRHWSVAVTSDSAEKSRRCARKSPIFSRTYRTRPPAV